jgi:hypothetical protein
VNLPSTLPRKITHPVGTKKSPELTSNYKHKPTIRADRRALTGQVQLASTTLKAPAAKSLRYLLRALFAFAILTPVVVYTKLSTAGISAQDIKTHVEIDGVNYGTFDHIDGLKEFHDAGDAATPSFRKVSFVRDFVTDPSLYLWAKNVMQGRTDLKDVHVVMENRDGEELSRYVLKFCQPLSWTVEAANPALGGFHETIDIAVQEISLY